MLLLSRWGYKQSYGFRCSIAPYPSLYFPRDMHTYWVCVCFYVEHFSYFYAHPRDDSLDNLKVLFLCFMISTKCFISCLPLIKIDLTVMNGEISLLMDKSWRVAVFMLNNEQSFVSSDMVREYEQRQRSLRELINYSLNILA
jgi:hypothetical protein